MSYEDIVRNIRSQAAEVNATRYPDASTPKEVKAPGFEDYSNSLGYANADYEAKKQIQQSWLAQHGDAWRQAGRDPAADLAQYAPLSAPQKGSATDTDWLDSAAQAMNRSVAGMSNTIASYLNDSNPVKQNLQNMGKYYAQEANINEANFNPVTRDENLRSARLDAELSKKYNGDVPVIEQAKRALGDIATAPVRTLAGVAGSSAVQLPALAASAAGVAVGGVPGAVLGAVGTLGGLALNTGTTAGEVGQGAYDAVMATPIIKLEGTEPFKKAFAEAKALNLSNIEAERVAQRAVAEDAQRYGGKIGGGVGFIAGLVSAGLGAGAAAKKAAGKAVGHSFLKSLGVETVTEATEEVVVQGGQNVTQQRAGLDTKISEGLVKAGILGAYGGAGQTGAGVAIGKGAKAAVDALKGGSQTDIPATDVPAPTLDQAKASISFDERLKGMPESVKTMAEDLVQTVIDNPNPTPEVQASIDTAKDALKSYGFTDQDLSNVYGPTVVADPTVEKQPVTGTKASEIQVGTYKPSETGGEPGTEAPVRLVNELAKAGPITLEAVNEVAVKHEQGYAQWVQGTRSEVSRVPKQDFIAGTADNILATAALMGLPMDERTSAAATEALANSQASDSDINNLGSRLTADGNSLMSESEYQATQNGTASDMVGKYVLYGNVEGFVIKRDNGLYVVDNRPGNTQDIFIEGGESQSTPAQLGLKIMNPPMVNLPAQRVGSGAAPATQVAQAQLTYEQALFEDALNLLVLEVGPQQAETFLAALEMRINEGATPAQIAKEIENEINNQSRDASAQTSNGTNDTTTNADGVAEDSQPSTNNDPTTNGVIDTTSTAEEQAAQLRADKEQRAAEHTQRLENFLYGLDPSLRGATLAEMLPDVRVVAELPQRFANEVAKYLNDNNLPWLDRFGQPTTDRQELSVNGVREGAALRRNGDGLTYIFAGNSVASPVSTLLHETWHKYQNREGDKNKAASLWNQVQSWAKAKPDTLQRRAYEYGKQVMDSGDRMNGPLEMIPVMLNYLWAEGVRPQTKGELGGWVDKVLATLGRFVRTMLGLPTLSEQQLMDIAAQMILGDATGKLSTEFLGEKEKTRKNTAPSFSVADIAKLTDNGRSLKEFSQQFAGSIKQADRKVEDADKIALDYIDDVIGSPASVLPQVSGASLSYKQYLRMPDGTDYDPNKLEHITATDLTKSIYAAVKSGRIEQALEQEAKATNKSRAKDLSGLAKYLKNNLEYRPTEAAVILKAASKWGMRMTTNNDKAVVQLVEITNKNATAIAVLTGLDASALAEEMRKGLPLKAAFQAALQSQVDLREKKALESGKEGWVVYKKSDKHEDHVALRDGCVGREWCTAGAVSTAANQLRRGDFHVFYKKGEPIVALRTENGRLGEAPRGSLSGQALTDEERGIAERRLRGQPEPAKAVKPTAAPTEAQPAVTGGEDFLEDQAFMAAVKENNFDSYSDMQLWMLQGYKLKAGNFSKSKLPSSATSVIKRAILKRKPKEQWSIEGYATGTATTDWEKARYVSGDMILNKDKIAKNVLVVKGYVELSGNATAPNLTTVGGALNLLGSGSAPNVTNVGSWVRYAKDLPSKLKAVGGVIRNGLGQIEYTHSVPTGVDAEVVFKDTPLDPNYVAPTEATPIVTGGEAFLDDQKVLNDIQSGAIKNYPDTDLWMLQGYKMKAGDYSGSEHLPWPARKAVTDTIADRYTDAQWHELGYYRGLSEFNGGDIDYPANLKGVKYIVYELSVTQANIAAGTVATDLVRAGSIGFAAHITRPLDISFPKLETTGSVLWIGGDIANLDFPVLKTVTGPWDVTPGSRKSKAAIKVPELLSIGGTASPDTLSSVATAMPKLTTVGWAMLSNGADLPSLTNGIVAPQGSMAGISIPKMPEGNIDTDWLSEDDAADYSLFQPHHAPRTLKDTQDALASGRVKTDPWYRGMKNGIVKVFADATRPFDTWAKGFGTPQEQERLIQTKDLAKTRAASLNTVYDQKYTVPLSQALNNVIKDTNVKDMETAKHLVGMWMSAIYAPFKNADFIAQDAKAVAEAEQAFIDAGGDMVGLRAELSASSTTRPSQARLTARSEAAAKRFAKASDKVKETSRAYVRALEQQEMRAQAINDPNQSMDPTETRAQAGLAGGYNDATAAKMVADIEAKIPKALLEAAAKPVYDMLKAKSQLDIQTGKVALSVSTKWFNHPRYVPLTGDPRTDDSAADIFGTGSMNQAKDKAAEGRRSSLAQNAIDAAFEQLGKSVNYYGWLPFKMELTATYERLLKQYGTDQAVFENAGVKRARETPQTNISNSVVFRNGADVTKNGGGWVYTLDSQDAIEGLQEANKEPSPGMLKWVALATRIVSRSIVLMPGFAVVNVWRDGPERFVNIATRELKNYPGVNMNKVGLEATAHWANPSTFLTIKNVLADRMGLPGVTKALAKVGGNDADAALLREMLEQGASSTTGSYTSSDTKSLAGKLASIDSTLTKQVNNFVWWSDSFELKAPFAIYKALRAQNVDARTASAMVLSTMNFTKQGSAMSPLKSLYMFAQPAVTGAHQTVKTLKTTKGQVLGASMFLGGMAVYAMLGEMGGDDPVTKKRRIDMLNAGTVEKSLPIYMPDGSVVKVPVPFGLWQLMWSAAANTSRALNGTTHMLDAGTNIFKSALKSVSPIGMADTEATKDLPAFLAQLFAPTLVKPIVNVAANTNTFGSSIHNDVKPGMPAWRQARKDTPNIYVETSRLLLDNASINVSPESLRELTGLIAYGPVGEARKGLIDNPAKDERGIKRPDQAVDRFVMEQADTKTASAYYYEARAELAKIHLRKLSAKPGESDLTDKERQLNAILEADDRVHSTINAQWAQLRKMKNDGRITGDEYRQRYQQLTTRDNESRARFITRYNEVK